MTASVVEDEQVKQDDDGDRHADQPENTAFTHRIVSIVSMA